MKLLTFLFLALPLLASATPSDPVGVLRLKLRGNSDTIVSLPLHRPALVEGEVTARDGNTLTLSATIPSFPDGGAYALVMNGPLEGALLPINGSNSSTVTIAPTSYDVSRLDPEHGGALIAVIPYWTLDSIFPSGLGVNATTGSPFATEVLLFSHTTAGINRSASQVFFYFAGTPAKAAGWYQVGNTAALKGSQRLEPGRYFMVRHNVPVDTTLTIAGRVQMTALRSPISTLAPQANQDNLIGLTVATPVTLGASDLVSSGAFAPTSSTTPQSDQLIVFDNSVVGKNKSASTVFFYLASGGAKPAGWYRVGNTASTADSFSLKPGEGFIIRKRGSTTPQTSEWDYLPVYLQ